MSRWKIVLPFIVLGVAALSLFQNCGTPLPSNGDSNGKVDESSVTTYAKANGMTGTVSIPADSAVVWEWKTAAPVTKGKSRVYGCPNPAYNHSVEFEWANGMTGGAYQGISSDPNRAGCTREVCFESSKGSVCVTVNFTTPRQTYARANGQSGYIMRRADEAVTWEWKTEAPKQYGTAEWRDCKDASRNKSESFDFANGTTDGSQLGSSMDYRRDGCHQKVCFISSAGSECVNVSYHMRDGAYYAKANGEAGVVFRPANQPTIWSLKTETPVVRSTVESTQCTNPEYNIALTEFAWANGKTEHTEVGSSADPGRVGCHRETCFHTATKSHCVLVIYQ